MGWCGPDCVLSPEEVLCEPENRFLRAFSQMGIRPGLVVISAQLVILGRHEDR